MSTLAIDTYTLLTALKGTGKSANYSAEEIANAVLASNGIIIALLARLAHVV